MFARKERGLRQFIPPLLLAQVTHSPDKIIVGFKAEPRLHDVPDTETLALTSEEAPRALQLPPEHHEAFLIVLNCNHLILNLNFIRNCSRSAIDASIIALA